MGPSFLCTNQVILSLIKNKNIWAGSLPWLIGATWAVLTRSRVFETLARAFDFLLKLQKLGRMFG